MQSWVLIMALVLAVVIGFGSYRMGAKVGRLETTLDEQTKLAGKPTTTAAAAAANGKPLQPSQAECPAQTSFSTAQLCAAPTQWQTQNLFYDLTPTRDNLGEAQLCKMKLVIRSKNAQAGSATKEEAGFVSSTSGILNMKFGAGYDSAILKENGQLQWSGSTYWLPLPKS